jgi:hypothetical protein
LEGTYFGFILNALQKLFRCTSTSGKKFVTPRSNLVNFSTPASLSLPNGLEIPLLFHRVQQRIERPGAQVDFEAVPNLQIDLIAPSRLSLEESKDDQVKVILDQAFSPRLVQIFVQRDTSTGICRRKKVRSTLKPF